MLVFLSDLHLTDTQDRSTIDLPRLLRALEEVLEQAVDAGVGDVRLVLLGDIFELLKSRVWLDRNLRPWDEPAAAHVEATAHILAAIVDANRGFLDGLRRLAGDFPLRFEYLPGNHDRPLNTPMGSRARADLQSLLPFPQTGGEPFRPVFTDADHGVLAKHGHEWDPANRYGEDRAAIGDAVVVDLLLPLPALVSRELGLDERDPSLAFLHEVDNVRPQHPRVMARWLFQGLDRIAASHPGAAAAVQRSLLELAESFRLLTREERFAHAREGRWWSDVLFRLAHFVLDRFGTLRTASLLPREGEGPGPFREEAFWDLQAWRDNGRDYRYILCGHTHIHELVPLQLEVDEPPRLYINTGTWRRTQRLAEVCPRGLPGFSTWQEECLVCIFSPDEQRRGLPAYEVHRFTRGQALV